jgi:predicted nucleic acid-binding protein
MPGITLDTGALIAIERASPRMQALLDEANLAGLHIDIPAGALAQAWRGTPRQARLARLLRLTNVTVRALDEANAKAAGALCGHSSTNDPIDASIVINARRNGHTVITSDPGDIHRLDPTLRIITI